MCVVCTLYSSCIHMCTVAFNAMRWEVSIHICQYNKNFKRSLCTIPFAGWEYSIRYIQFKSVRNSFIWFIWFKMHRNYCGAILAVKREPIDLANKIVFSYGKIHIFQSPLNFANSEFFLITNVKNSMCPQCGLLSMNKKDLFSG